jgi:hypothetical protein
MDMTRESSEHLEVVFALDRMSGNVSAEKLEELLRQAHVNTDEVIVHTIGSPTSKDNMSTLTEFLVNSAKIQISQSIVLSMKLSGRPAALCFDPGERCIILGQAAIFLKCNTAAKRGFIEFCCLARKCLEPSFAIVTREDVRDLRNYLEGLPISMKIESPREKLSDFSERLTEKIDEALDQM